MNESYSRTLFALIICLTCMLIYGTLTNGHNWGGDFSQYIMQAQSVAEGAPRNFIETSRFTVQQSSYSFSPVAYPWGFPVLLAPFVAVFGLNIIALKIVGVISFLVFLFLLWVGFRKYHSHLWLIGLLCLFSLNPCLLNYLNNIISDIPFLLFSTFNVLFMGVMFIERRRIVSPACDSILIGISIAAAFFIRSNGILLLLTLAITQFIAFVQRISREETANNRSSFTFKSFFSPNRTALQDVCISLLPYASFLGASLLWRVLFPEGGLSYIDRMDTISADSIAYNLGYYVQLLSNFFTEVPFHYLLYGASVPCAIAGLIRRFRSDYHMIIYVMLTFLLYIFWTGTPGLRYLFPVLPFNCSFVLTGLEAFQGGATTIERAFRKLACLLPIVFVLSYFGMNSIRGAYENLIHDRETTYGSFTATSTSMFSFIEQNIEAECTVIFFKPRVMRMLTGRRSLAINKMEELLRGDYLCLYLKSKAYSQISFDAILQLYEQGAVRLIFENSEFRVYRLIKDRGHPLMGSYR